MRQPPSTPYSGVTVVLDSTSRLNRDRLLFGTAADWFEESCLVPPHSLNSIELRTMDCTAPFLPDTRFILLLGPKTAAHYGGHIERHGYPLIVVNKFPGVIAYDPQDCNDHRSMSDDDEDEDDSSDRELKDKSPTRRKNRRFWTAWHVRKLLSKQPPVLPPLDAILYPRLDEAINVLNNTRNENLYLDIETSRIHGCLRCVGFSTDNTFPRVYVVPVYLFNGQLAYSNFHLFHRALSLAFLNNTVVAHNGAGFDWFVLRAFYKFPFPVDPYDTMIANHRCFPEIEKSLAHVMAQWTWLPYHKDQNLEPFNMKQEEQSWTYNARDVYALKPIKDAQLTHAQNDQGLMASIKQANASIVPYLDTSLTGMRLDIWKLTTISQRLRIEKAGYARVAGILTNIQNFNPGSSKQCSKFFHDTLNYQVVKRSETGAPAMGSKQLYQLHLKYDNPVIPVILKYREVAKDLANLESELWEEP